MYRKLLLIASLGTLLGGCAPYATNGYVQTEVYSVQSPAYEYRPYTYPYGYSEGYYVRPAPRYYLPPPPPHYYRPPPPPRWRPGPPGSGMGWHGGPPPQWGGHGRGWYGRGYH